MLHRFFRGEPSREVFEIALGIARAIRLFFRRKTAVEKTLAVIVHQFFDPLGLDDIDAMTQNRHDRKAKQTSSKAKGRLSASHNILARRGYKLGVVAFDRRPKGSCFE